MTKIKELQKELKFYEKQLQIALKKNADEKNINFNKGMILNTKIKISVIK